MINDSCCFSRQIPEHLLVFKFTDPGALFKIVRGLLYCFASCSDPVP